MKDIYNFLYLKWKWFLIDRELNQIAKRLK